MELLDSILVGTPSAYALNDAMALSLLLEKGSAEGGKVILRFADASRLMRQNRMQDALEAFETFVKNHPGSTLLDRALANRIELLEEMERYTETIQACRRLSLDVPESPLCAWSLMTLGSNPAFCIAAATACELRVKLKSGVTFYVSTVHDATFWNEGEHSAT